MAGWSSQNSDSDDDEEVRYSKACSAWGTGTTEPTSNEPSCRQDRPNVPDTFMPSARGSSDISRNLVAVTETTRIASSGSGRCLPIDSESTSPSMAGAGVFLPLGTPILSDDGTPRANLQRSLVDLIGDFHVTVSKGGVCVQADTSKPLDDHHHRQLYSLGVRLQHDVILSVERYAAGLGELSFCKLAKEG